MNSDSRSSVEGELGAPGAVGDLLRASRLRQGQELEDVARALRIRIVYLQAIEDGRFEDLPAPAYAVGFIRSYAGYLGLDGEQVVKRFKTEATGQGRKLDLHFPAMVAADGIPRGAIVTVGALILIGAYAGWYFLSTKDMFQIDGVPPVPETISRAADGIRSEPSSALAAIPTPSTLSTEATTSPAEPSISAPAAPAPQAVAPAPVAPVTAMTPPPPAAVPQPAPAAVAAAPSAAAPEPGDDDDDEADSTPAPTATGAPAPTVSAPVAPVPTPTASPRVAAAPVVPAPRAAEPSANSEQTQAALDDRGGVDAPAVGSQMAALTDATDDPTTRIVLKAVVDSWIQVRDGQENRLLLTRLLHKGETYTVPHRDGLSLVTGNAGGLEITVGGEPAPPLGPVGLVRRNVALDPVRLRAGTAVIE